MSPTTRRSATSVPSSSVQQQHTTLASIIVIRSLRNMMMAKSADFALPGHACSVSRHSPRLLSAVVLSMSQWCYELLKK